MRWQPRRGGHLGHFRRVSKHEAMLTRGRVWRQDTDGREPGYDGGGSGGYRLLFNSYANSYAALQPLAAWIACHTVSGVAGMSMCLMPNSDSASAIAFITEVSAPAQPASPHPLTPSG